MKHETFHYESLNQLKQKIHSMGLSVPLEEDTSVLRNPLLLGNRTVSNRLVIQPMEGCDGTFGGAFDTLTKRRYERFARSGAGLIWFEAVAVLPQGRNNPRQLLINEENLDSFKEMTNRVKEICIRENGFEPVLIMQATHSGRYSKPDGAPKPVIAYRNPNFEKERQLDDSCVISDWELQTLEEAYGKSAKLAEQAGFDGVDIKCCHGYLCSEFLSAYTRPEPYGGSFENRVRLLTNGIQSAKAEVNSDFIITSRLNIYDGFCYPYGFGVNEQEGLTPDMSEPLRLVELLHNKLDIRLLNITLGNPYQNPHVNRPYDQGGYLPEEHPLEGVNRMYQCTEIIQKNFPDLAVIGSGLSYLRQFGANLAAGAVQQGYCKLAGFGRQTFANPHFAKEILETGAMDQKKCCVTCGKCTELMRAGSTAGCVIHDRGVYRPIYNRDVKKLSSEVVL